MNTGRKIYPFLKQINAATGAPTGLLKANVPLDPDYVAPIIDYAACPLTSWRAIDGACLIGKRCAPGWVLSADQTTCTLIEQQGATPPAIGSTIAVKGNDDQWNNGGAVIYQAGYPSNGDGTVAVSLLTPHLWVNGDSPFDAATRNEIDGRMNAAGIWGSPNPPVNEWIGFTKTIHSSTVKTVFIGLSADNKFKFTFNGQVIVEAQNTRGGPNFNYWNIYPVQLQAGDNTIEMSALNLSGPAGFAAEIYDCTQAQLQAVTTGTQLEQYIIFSTAELIGLPFDLGLTYGWSCPTGWFLVQENGVYLCRKTSSTASTVGNTGMKQFSNRERLVNGSPDGFQEPNLNGVGVGPYFPPVQDLTNCPI